MAAEAVEMVYSMPSRAVLQREQVNYLAAIIIFLAAARLVLISLELLELLV